ncbi:DUF6414 family protein [Xenorhabdus szentirmaii]|uniref:DUF6414 family protein n=1 Tax=Xenorhabdus szentirmaii TaxID=290112 RepID=UPI000C0404F5|nr:hypothetical protein [Xenorhabdus szentirmaii]PHM40477.1 hypothetical protein Xszus_00137 [Xenorhabdus szentirmaii]
MAQGSQDTGSLYDFLYLDKDRIYSIIAQLNDNGVLKTLKQTNGDRNTDSSELDVTGEASAMLLKAKGGAKKKLTEELHESLELTHDTTWSLPLQLLDLLSESEYIKQGTDNSRLGSLSLLQGYIKVFDVTTLKQSLPLLAQFTSLQEATHSPTLPPKAKKNSKKKDINDMEMSPGITLGMMNQFLSMVPDSLQINFYENSNNQSWMALDKGSLTINSSDLSLKYGSNIPGKWYVLGIIDALPDDSEGGHKFKNYEEDGELKSGLFIMIDQLRNLFGRNPHKYGVTPLIIFRKIEQ